jgi:cytochrome P450
MIPIHKGDSLSGISTGFIRDSLLFTVEMVQKLGDFYRLIIPGHQIYIISRSDLVKYVLINNARNYAKGKIDWKSLSLETGKGIATSEGSEWLETRRIMHPYLTGGLIKVYTPQRTSSWVTS